MDSSLHNNNKKDKKKRRQHLKLVVVLFVEVSFYCSFEGTECDIGCHKGENSIVFGALEKECWPKALVLKWGMHSVHVFTEE